MSINRIVILVVVAGYVVVNVLMQIDFFAGRNIFAKYKETATAVDALRVGEEAYFAKTGFLLILLVLSALSLSPKLCAFFRSESCVSSQSEGGLKQRPCKLLVIQGLLCIKSYAQDYLWIASLEAAFLLGFRGPSQKPCLSRSW